MSSRLLSFQFFNINFFLLEESIILILYKFDYFWYNYCSSSKVLSKTHN
jgi:hypothetical protein